MKSSDTSSAIAEAVSRDPSTTTTEGSPDSAPETHPDQSALGHHRRHRRCGRGCSDDSGLATSSVAAATTEPPQPSSPATPAPPSPESTPPADPATVLPFVDDFDTDVSGWGGPFQRFEDGAYVRDLSSGQSDVRAADTLIDVEDEIDSVVITTAFIAVGVDAVAIQ